MRHSTTGFNPSSSLERISLVQRHVQFQNIHARLTEYAQVPPLSVDGYQALYGICRSPPSFRNAGGLCERIRWADLRVEAASRSRNCVRRNSASVVGVIFAKLFAVFLQAIGERGIRWTEIASARVGRVIRVLRWPWMEILRLGKVLTYDLGPDHLAVAFDQTPIRLLMEDRLCNPRHRQRIQNSGDYRQNERNQNRGSEFFQHIHISLRKMQEAQQPVNCPDARERRNDSSEPIDQKIAAQQRARRQCAILHAAQRQWYKRDDDQRIEDDRRENRALGRMQAHNV